MGVKILPCGTKMNETVNLIKYWWFTLILLLQDIQLDNSMLDLDNSSVNKECAMCTDVHCEDTDEDIIVYRDQGVSTEEHDKATYGKFTKT